MKPIIYVSGPMTGKPLLNFPAFHKAAANLRDKGYEVVNPAELDAQDDGKLMQWEDYMRRDIRALMDCTHIALLPEWEKSRGAVIEARLAADLGLHRLYLTAEGLLG